MTGAGLEVVTVVDTALLFELGSAVVEVAVAAFVIDAPFATGQFTVATIVMVSEAPAASDENVTVRLFPVPPQLPPPVALQETKVVSAGKLFVTTTFCAALGPLLPTVNV